MRQYRVEVLGTLPVPCTRWVVVDAVDERDARIAAEQLARADESPELSWTVAETPLEDVLAATGVNIIGTDGIEEVEP